VALLDVDNFKSINDRLGHDTGDAALVHLADVARSALRPQDMLARYGGEEFVVVLPETGQAQGIEAMTRLQRELTTRFFLQNNEKILITFSAGVAQLGAEEGSTEALRRADQGMYLAKRAGKNRVVAA
jgi:diguanylate cyclase